jgi:hypothetical protein
VVTAGLAFFVSSLFFYTYQLGVDTLLMCDSQLSHACPAFHPPP